MGSDETIDDLKKKLATDKPFVIWSPWYKYEKYLIIPKVGSNNAIVPINPDDRHPTSAGSNE